MLPHFHPLHTALPRPAKFTDPFCYEPHPLCLAAAKELQDYIAGDGSLRAEADKGKMFGVLVIETGDGLTGYLAAFSGLLGGSNDHAFFVPPVFDATPPDGYFKTHEAEISAINKRIDSLQSSEEYQTALREKVCCTEENAKAEDEYRQAMRQAKVRRDARRQSPQPLTAEEEAAMTRESQHMKAELRRLKRRGAELLAAKEQAVKVFEDEIEALKARRRQMSDALQRWLFSQYSMLNAHGERRNLCDIFAHTPQRVPPAGAGDCCAPKLLQYAYLNRMRPVCMAEFWWGGSPKGEVRHHLHFYPACRGKCLPILGHMLKGLKVEKGCYESTVTQPLEVVYEDEWLAVVNKPAGMKTVPGCNGGTSVLEDMRQRHPDKTQLAPVHRLDMDTSGLIIVAFNTETYKKLQAQFLRREVFKRYTALLDGVSDCPIHGEISLPMRPDPLDRPYQKVDFVNGKESVTEYKILGTQGNATRIALFPHTGRTHQLRLHCAHKAGLGTPIRGDRLYGHGGGRLCLHAEAIEFKHPVTGKEMKFERKAEF